MINKGFLLITDITGYTSFLTDSELDHAQHIIEALFTSQLDVITPPLTVSNFQGDAILCYTREEESRGDSWLLDQVEKIYSAFRTKMAEMQIDPPCSCKACSTINLLDLKIFLHFGEFIVRTMGNREEILGKDVIVAHRMMKNSVTEVTGLSSYLLVSKEVYDRFGRSATRFAFTHHTESFEGVTEQILFVAPLSA